MKSKYLLSLFFLLLMLVVYQASRQLAHGNSFGAPLLSGRGFTNSPFDGRACNSAGCHAATLNSGPGTAEITSDIPTEGYRAGVTYHITAKVSEATIKKFGFQMTSENEDDHKAGRFIASTQTRVPSDFYITQGTSSSSSAGNETKSWSFSWTAPDAPGSGPITFYAAFNAANSNGQPSGDHIYTNTLTLAESIFSGIESNTRDLDYAYTLFPNPTTGNAFIQVHMQRDISNLKYILYTPDGKPIIAKVLKVQGRNFLKEMIPLEEVPAGIYFLSLSSDNDTRVSRLIIH